MKFNLPKPIILLLSGILIALVAVIVLLSVMVAQRHKDSAQSSVEVVESASDITYDTTTTTTTTTSETSITTTSTTIATTADTTISSETTTQTVQQTIQSTESPATEAPMTEAPATEAPIVTTPKSTVAIVTTPAEKYDSYIGYWHPTTSGENEIAVYKLTEDYIEFSLLMLPTIYSETLHVELVGHRADFIVCTSSGAAKCTLYVLDNGIALEYVRSQLPYIYNGDYCEYTKKINTSVIDFDGTGSVLESYDYFDNGGYLGAVSTNGDNLNIRELPTVGSNKVGSIPNDTAVDIIGMTDRWYEVRYNGQVGFVSADYITLIYN